MSSRRTSRVDPRSDAPELSAQVARGGAQDRANPPHHIGRPSKGAVPALRGSVVGVRRGSVVPPAIHRCEVDLSLAAADSLTPLEVRSPLPSLIVPHAAEEVVHRLVAVWTDDPLFAGAALLHRAYRGCD